MAVRLYVRLFDTDNDCYCKDASMIDLYTRLWNVWYVALRKYLLINLNNGLEQDIITPTQARNIVTRTMEIKE